MPMALASAICDRGCQGGCYHFGGRGTLHAGPCPGSARHWRGGFAGQLFPTVELPQTNVQDAIVAAADLAVSGFATYGIGITGNATSLPIRRYGKRRGHLPFDGTTTGTFPTGVAAGDTGMIELWQQAGATAMMELHHATSNRLFSAADDGLCPGSMAGGAGGQPGHGGR